MPIYVYRCEACLQVHEALQKLSDEPLRSCPSCHEEALKKLIAPAGIIFKGSGFHKNDYGSSGGRKSTTEAPPPSPSTPPAPEKKADSSPPKASGGTESKVA